MRRSGARTTWGATIAAVLAVFFASCASNTDGPAGPPRAAEETGADATAAATVASSLSSVHQTTLIVDAAADTSAAEHEATHVIGSTFDVAIVVQSPVEPYAAYQVELGWDSPSVSVERITNAARAYAVCSPSRSFADSAAIACIRPDVSDAPYSGQLAKFTLRCEQPGTVTLHLQALGQGSIGTRIESRPEARVQHLLSVVDAIITCIA